MLPVLVNKDDYIWFRVRHRDRVTVKAEISVNARFGFDVTVRDWQDYNLVIFRHR